MAARGLASIQKWEPIKTGFKVRFKGVSEELRDIVIREPESQFPVVIIRSQKELVELPLKPGRYSIEVALLRDGRWTDSIKTPATVGNEEYTEVSLDQ